MARKLETQIASTLPPPPVPAGYAYHPQHPPQHYQPQPPSHFPQSQSSPYLSSPQPDYYHRAPPSPRTSSAYAYSPNPNANHVPPGAAAPRGGFMGGFAGAPPAHQGLTQSMSDMSLAAPSPSPSQRYSRRMSSISAATSPLPEPSRRQSNMSSMSASHPPSVYLSPTSAPAGQFSPSLSASPRPLSRVGGAPPTITYPLPDLPALAANRGGGSDPAEQLAWAKSVLLFADLRTKAAGDQQPTRRDSADLQPLLDEAIQTVLYLAAAGFAGGRTYAEALYTRADLAATGLHPTHVARDPRSAFRDFEAAAKGGYPAGYFRLGRDYEAVPDMPRARDCYERGVKAGDVSCLYRLGTAYLLGQLDLAQEPPRAIPLLRQAAEKASLDQPNPAYVFGMILAGEYDHVQIDPRLLESCSSGRSLQTESKEFLERAAYFLYPPALYKMGLCHEFALHGCAFDPLLSIQYYSKASELGEVEADMALSKWFLCGHEGSFEADERLAYTFAEKAARKGLPSAMFALGYYAEVGVGCPVDLQMARKWYSRAASQGNDEAKDRLAALESSGAVPLSRDEHEAAIGDKLVRRRTQAKQRWDGGGGGRPVQAQQPRPAASQSDTLRQAQHAAQQPLTPAQQYMMSVIPPGFQAPPPMTPPINQGPPAKYTLSDDGPAQTPPPQQVAAPPPSKGPATFEAMGIQVGKAKKDDCRVM